MTVTARKPASYFSSPPGGDPSARPRLGVYLLTAMAVVVATLTAVALTVIVQELFFRDTPCETAQCHYEVGRLSESLDGDVPPCRDFYAFVCGDSTWTPQGGTIAAEAHVANLLRLNQTLHATARAALAVNVTGKSLSPAFRELAFLYATCHGAYSADHDLHDTMYAYLRDVGVSPTAWLLEANSTEALLEEVASVSLSRGVPSFLWLRQSPSSGLLSVAPALPMFSAGVLVDCKDYEERKQLVERVLSAIDELTQDLEDLAFHVVRAHAHPAGFIKGLHQGSPVFMKMKEAFYFLNDSDLSAWLRIIERYLPYQAKQPLTLGSTAIFRNTQLLPNVSALALERGRLSVPLGNMFAFSALLEPVFEWEYRRYNTIAYPNASFEVVHLCAKVALGMLPRPWTMFVTQSLTAHKMDVKGVRRLARIVLAKIKKEYEKSTWQTQLGKVDVLKHIDGLRWRMPDERDYEGDASDTPLPEHRGDNRTYLRRLASLRLVSHWASNDPSGFDSGYGEKPLPSGLRYPPERPVVRYEYERNTLWVTPAALSRPFYYSGAEPHINLAALGALLAYEMWSALIRHTPPPRPPGSVSSFQDEVSCYVAAYRALTNDTTPDTFVGPELYRRIKALRTVLDASREFFSKDRRSTGRWPDVGEMQLFFVRYCSLSCVRNTAGVARASQCDIPIASTPAFTRLFDCRPTDPLANLPANCNDAS